MKWNTFESFYLTFQSDAVSLQGLDGSGKISNDVRSKVARTADSDGLGVGHRLAPAEAVPGSDAELVLPTRLQEERIEAVDRSDPELKCTGVH